VEPLTCGLVERPDREDRAAIGNLEIAHVRGLRRRVILRRRSPTRRVAVQGSAYQAAFNRSPAARSMSRRLSLFGIVRACAVAATVTSHRVSIDRSSSTRWTALIGSTMR